MSRSRRITIELSADEARQLYLITKRLCFDDVLEHTDPGSSEHRKDQAYLMIAAVAKVTDALLEQSATGGA